MDMLHQIYETQEFRYLPSNSHQRNLSWKPDDDWGPNRDLRIIEICSNKNLASHHLQVQQFLGVVDAKARTKHNLQRRTHYSIANVGLAGQKKPPGRGLELACKVTRCQEKLQPPQKSLNSNIQTGLIIFPISSAFCIKLASLLVVRPPKNQPTKITTNPGKHRCLFWGEVWLEVSYAARIVAFNLPTWHPPELHRLIVREAQGDVS